MSDVKQRGPQYFLLVAIILAGIGIGIFLKPKMPKKVQMSSKATKANNFTNKKEQNTFEKVTPVPTVQVDSATAPVATKSDALGIDQWYENLLVEYTSNAEDLSNHHDIVIRYYRKPKDENKIDSLKTLGFYIHERPTKKLLKSFPTNTIYYGDSVRREDILVVAYQLRMAGFTLQAIEHSRFGDNWKSHSIELGTDTTMLKVPELTLDTIKYIVENNPYIKTRM